MPNTCWRPIWNFPVWFRTALTTSADPQTREGFSPCIVAGHRHETHQLCTHPYLAGSAGLLLLSHCIITFALWPFACSPHWGYHSKALLNSNSVLWFLHRISLLNTDCYCDNELSNLIEDEFPLNSFSFLKARESLCFPEPFSGLEAFHLSTRQVDTWGFRLWPLSPFFKRQQLPQALPTAPLSAARPLS